MATSATGIETSEPIFLVFNFGLDEGFFQAGVDAFLGLLQSQGQVGDYNQDGELDAGDLDLQAIAIAGGEHPKEFDLNDDDLVNFDDRLMWVDELKNTWMGDANLDGEFNSGDMVQVFVKGKYETGQDADWEKVTSAATGNSAAATWSRRSSPAAMSRANARRPRSGGTGTPQLHVTAWARCHVVRRA